MSHYEWKYFTFIIVYNSIVTKSYCLCLLSFTNPLNVGSLMFYNILHYDHHYYFFFSFNYTSRYYIAFTYIFIILELE